MDKVKEITKNFFVCGVLMVIAGAVLIAISKQGLGMVSVLCGIVFLVIGIVFLVKDLKNASDQ